MYKLHILVYSNEEHNMDNLPVSPCLQNFLHLVISNEIAPRNGSAVRILLTLSQDIFYAVHQRKRHKEIFKKLFFSLLIKSLTNNTEPISTISRLGHAVSHITFGDGVSHIQLGEIISFILKNG